MRFDCNLFGSACWGRVVAANPGFLDGPHAFDELGVVRRYVEMVMSHTKGRARSRALVDVIIAVCKGWGLRGFFKPIDTGYSLTVTLGDNRRVTVEIENGSNEPLLWSEDASLSEDLPHPCDYVWDISDAPTTAMVCTYSRGYLNDALNALFKHISRVFDVVELVDVK